MDDERHGQGMSCAHGDESMEGRGRVVDALCSFFFSDILHFNFFLC
jgi:hypothetical protein